MPRFTLFSGALLALFVSFSAAAASPAESAAHAVLERVLGASAAAQITLNLVPAQTGRDGRPIDAFTIGGSTGSIVIQGTTGSALTMGAGWYLKYVAYADLV